MEIQKIFSEINTDERIYSVLMNEEELALFSEISAELEQREFGKYDKLLAERNNIDITTLRNQRVGFQGTGTVNDIINARSGKSGFVSAEFDANSDLSDFGKKIKERS